MRLWPQSLAGQLIAGLLLVMTIAFVVSFTAFVDERRLALHEASRFQFLSRIASVVRLVEGMPPDMRAAVADRASGPLLQFTVSRASAVGGRREGLPARIVHRRLRHMLNVEGSRIRVGEIDDRDGFWRWGPWRRMHHERSDDEPDERPRWGGHDPDGRMVIAVRLSDGRWLNARTMVPPMTPSWAVASLSVMAVTTLVLAVLIVLLVRRSTRPLAALAAAAESAGRGDAFTPVAEKGPTDVRETISAFNRMQERQQRFIADRTRMLAAISHDLRTPITSLRIRAEFIDDAELQAKILATLDEMQAMAEATLAFVREDATEEHFVETDLGALAESVVADAADLDADATFAAPQGDRLIVSCRPNALRRALRNIVDNALAYGGSADVRLERTAQGAAIVVEDDGPGIAEPDLKRVFEPFVRLEESRSRETGGIGLGMAITRTIMRAHGGDAEIVNRDEGGLRVTLKLPAGRG